MAVAITALPAETFLAVDRGTGQGFARALGSATVELLHFGYKEALSCLFPAYIFVVLALSHYVPVPGLYRYDVLLLACVAMQAILYWSGLETADELKVITLFHLIGLAMEIYKVQIGSWAYPEEAWTKVLGVPLYSGFMYASVGSYVCQAWRRFDLRLTHWPSAWLVVPLATAIYLNFFLNRVLPDGRWLLTALVFVVFWRCSFEFRPKDRVRRMPVVLSFFLIAVFIWFAENIGTFLGAWKYPHQRDAWAVVDLHKLGSWFLLVIVSGVIVAQLKHTREKRTPRPT